MLALDDVSAHEARRSLEILVNDRAVAAIALDGKSMGRAVRIPLANAAARDGYLKLSFLYSGAATQDRCIDVRYVGDSLTIRPESAVEFEIGVAGAPDNRRHRRADAAERRHPAVGAAAAAGRYRRRAHARALVDARPAGGSRFHHGLEALPELVKRDDPRRWTRGLIVVGSLDRIASRLDAPVATVSAPAAADNTLAAARIGGVPVLLVADSGIGACRAAARQPLARGVARYVRPRRSVPSPRRKGRSIASASTSSAWCRRRRRCSAAPNSRS